ncbi:RNA polymerase sigma factor SigZ [Vibrio maerlii]|uniref:RNA polymerase sigma factor SigZ n=1 Tax=Vibrio maerlii TaxID=2231648 RepID=UPI000E3C8BC7|nr:RNA polymerase sigma factor SigZ [Vibrio maerlii]
MNSATEPLNLEQVWQEYENALGAFLRSKVSNVDDVEDLLQEVLIKTYQNLQSVNDASSVKAWLFQLANRTIIDFYRKRARIDRDKNISADELWFEQDDDVSIEQEMSQCIEPFIRALPKESSELLMSIDLKGESQKSIAEAQNISYSTLKSRVQKSRQQLKGLFSQCCDLTLDNHGSVIDCEQKPGQCNSC